ncbi:hypothetical protein M1271_06890 [Patescibacteria group bacterium]|nr:hypothetical protein [Patescibacteria group bacterium]MCL5798465.1 hypothetical protein [Patescibacteria group bacterium]
MRIKSYKLLIIVILFLAAFFRFYGINWDNNQHLHPDERFLTMVGNAILWPQDLFEYFNTSQSPLNPHNRGFGFFVYGTFPLFLTKFVADILSKSDYNNLTIVGRQLSAGFDLGTVLLVFLIARGLISRSKLLKPTSFKFSLLGKEYSIKSLDLFPLLSMLFYAVSALPIQLSHYFAVDTYLTFFTALTFFLLIKIVLHISIYDYKVFIFSSLLGISLGLAAASKITALIILPIIGLCYIFLLLKERKLLHIFTCGFIFSLSLYISFRITQPYAFISGNVLNPLPNPKLIENWKQLRSFDDPNAWFPPGVQWITTRPYIFPIKNFVFWGMGLPIGLLTLTAFLWYNLIFFNKLKNWRKSIRSASSGLILKKIEVSKSLQCDCDFLFFAALFFVDYVFLYQGAQFVKAMRYFILIYPFITVVTALFTTKIFSALHDKYKLSARILSLLTFAFIILILIYPFSFVSIYARNNSRIDASNWIYQNIPPGSVVSSEHWDDGLPLSLDNKSSGLFYKTVEFPLYNPDSLEKWKDMTQRLQEVNYIFLSSNRLYGSIMTVPSRYPITNRYYTDLFNGTLGFEKIAEFTSRPNLPLPFIRLCLTPPFSRYGIVAYKSQNCPLSGISFVDDYADESFTVYDHPKVIIFKKIKPVDYFSLIYLDRSSP